MKCRKILSQSIVHHLRNRELNNYPKCKTPLIYNNCNSFYNSIFPNFTVSCVDKPPCFLRKFTPNGKYFIAFSADQTSLEIYRFNGSQSGEHLLDRIEGDNMSLPVNDIKANLFNAFFKLLHTAGVASNGEYLNRECSLFSDDSRFVIVGSALLLPDEPYPNYKEVYQNNESMLPNAKIPFEDYTLHVIELESGRLCCSRRLRCDKIYLSHNQGIYLYNNTLAVLSVQHQTIHIYQLNKEGQLVKCRTIGRFCLEDNHKYDLFLKATLNQKENWHGKERCLNVLKHKILVHLYKHALNESMDKNSQMPLFAFHRKFDYFANLRIWKMQLLSESHLLIRYSIIEVVELKSTDPNSQPSFFAVYDFMEANVLCFYENTSPQLLALFEDYSDLFRNCGTWASNVHARQMHQRFKQTIANARSGGQSEAVKRMLALLPISAQSYSTSPYLDLSLFSYDDKWVSAMERPKACGDHPIRFFSKDCGLLKFKIYTGMTGTRPTVPYARRLVAFTFHPTEPFAISVQRANAEYIVNFHMRHSQTTP